MTLRSTPLVLGLATLTALSARAGKISLAPRPYSWLTGEVAAPVPGPATGTPGSATASPTRAAPPGSPAALAGRAETLRQLAARAETAGRFLEGLNHQLALVRLLEPLGPVGVHDAQRARRRAGRLAILAGDLARAEATLAAAFAWARANEDHLDDVERAELWALRVTLGELAVERGAPGRGAVYLREAVATPTENRTRIDGEQVLLARAHEALAKVAPDHPACGGPGEDPVRTHEVRAALFREVAAAGVPAPDAPPPPEATWSDLEAAAALARRLHDIDRAQALHRAAAEHPAARPAQRARSLMALVRLRDLCRGCALPPAAPIAEEAYGILRRVAGARAAPTLEAFELRLRVAAGAGEDTTRRLRDGLTKLVALRREALGDDHPSVAETELDLAALAQADGDTAAALAAGGRAITAALAAVPPATRPFDIEGRTRVERAFFRQSQRLRGLARWPQLAALWRRKIAFLTEAYGPRSRRVAWRRLSLAEALEAAGRPADALEAAAAGRAALAETGPVPALLAGLDLEARLRRAAGEAAAAARLAARARGWRAYIGGDAL